MLFSATLPYLCFFLSFVTLKIAFDVEYSLSDLRFASLTNKHTTQTKNDAMKDLCLNVRFCCLEKDYIFSKSFEWSFAKITLKYGT